MNPALLRDSMWVHMMIHVQIVTLHVHRKDSGFRFIWTAVEHSKTWMLQTKITAVIALQHDYGLVRACNLKGRRPNYLYAKTVINAMPDSYSIIKCRAIHTIPKKEKNRSGHLRVIIV